MPRLVNSSRPVGEVISAQVTHTTPPSGFLYCDGSAVSRTAYAALFALLGTTYGAGNGSTTFNLPDLRGRFLRSLDTTASTRDPDKASRTGGDGNKLGSTQGHAFQTHNHTQNPHNHNVPARGDESNGSLVSATNTPADNFTVFTADTTATNNSTGASGTNSQASSGETRPLNFATNYFIRY